MDLSEIGTSVMQMSQRHLQVVSQICAMGADVRQ
jgi:hypothetical protein